MFALVEQLEGPFESANLRGCQAKFKPIKGVAPPTHSRSARCRSFGGVISKACFFCILLQDIIKKVFFTQTTKFRRFNIC